MKRLFAIILALALVQTSAAAAATDLGVVELPNTGAPEAQEDFHRGLAALHSFYNDEAREAFREAQRIDADFALAYWGEALTYDFPFGANPDVDTARATLARLGENAQIRAEKAGSALERRLLHAVERLYGEGERTAREQAYYEVMKSLYEAHPENVEVAAFYALSILGKIELGRDMREKVEAVAIMESFLPRYPQHPGLLHYTIHAYDDAVLAPLGLRAAERYAQVAPASSHALHMPSHIFLQLGLWNKTTRSNIDAYEASVATARKTGRGWAAYDTHALSWLVYSLVMQGEHDEARRYLDELAHISDRLGGADRSPIYVLTAARYAVETGDWSAAPTPEIAENVDSPFTRGNAYFAAALRAVDEGRTDDARAVIGKMDELLAREDVKNNEGRLFVIGSSKSIIEAALAARAGDTAAALAAAANAAEQEARRPLPIGPTYPLKAANEYHGELLLQAGDAQGAIEAFGRALSRSAGRPQALLGLMKAYERTGQSEKADDIRRRLAGIR